MTQDAAGAIAPPTQPGQVDNRSTWPTVLGIIGIVVGAMGAIGYTCGSVFQGLLAFGVMPPFDPAQQQTMQSQPLLMVASLAVMLISTALSVWLIVVGVMLLRRQAGVRKQALAWAVCKIIAVIASVAVGLPAQLDAFQAQSQPPSPLFVAGFAAGMALVSILMYCLLPGFFLVWFNLGRFRKEVASWPSGEAR